MNEQVIALIGDVLNAWLPVFTWMAGIVAALAFGRLTVQFTVTALGVNPARASTNWYTPLLFDYVTDGGGEPDPPPSVPAGPWWRSLIAEWTGIMQGLVQSGAAFVRGDPLNPWWRISWRGVNRAYSHANTAVFFGLFFGAFVGAAAVSAGFPFGPTAAVYAVLGVIWVCTVIVIGVGLAWAECAFLLMQLLLEVAALLGYLAVAAALLLAGFAVAIVRRRGLSYVATLSQADTPIWKARIIPAGELKFSLRPWALDTMRRTAERKARRAARPPRSRAYNLFGFACSAFSIGTLVMFTVLFWLTAVQLSAVTTGIIIGLIVLVWLALPSVMLIFVDDKIAGWVLRHTKPGDDEVMTEAAQEPEPAGAQDEDFEASNP